MKARVKATGEIVEVSQYGKYNFLEYIGEKTGRLFLAEELDLLDSHPDYWTRLEHQYAGMAMQGILAKYGVEPLPDDAANDAREYAHALVEKLKEKEERK